MKTRLFLIVCACVCMLFPMKAMAAPTIMGDGGLFDPEWYAACYTDVAAVCGNDANALYEHYKAYGIFEGRKPLSDVTLNEEGNAVHKPVYLQYENLKNSGFMVEISIADQHMWVYQNHVLVQENDVVTGWANIHNTPRGIFQVIEKVNGKYLRGEDYVSWVDKWMRMTWSGIGMHDAQWRSKFGGKIYQRNGSHGCINMPKASAYALYDMISIGNQVIVY